MERTVPTTASEEVELYLRTIYSLLRTTAKVRIKTLEEVHAGMNSVLHPNARSASPDPSAFIYALLRLPDTMPRVHTVVLGQTTDIFVRAGYTNIESWTAVPARARRRRYLYNGKGTLACYIASRSDIDDIVPTLTAYQIEWNKLNALLRGISYELVADAAAGDEARTAELAKNLQMSVDDLERFRLIWQDRFMDYMNLVESFQTDLELRLLGGSLSHYWRATRAWWEHIEKVSPALHESPLYFISSNSHSIANLLSGFALQIEPELIDHLMQSGDRSLIQEWESINSGENRSSRENFLYYLLKRYQGVDPKNEINCRMEEHERQNGIIRIPSQQYFDVDAQVIDLSKLNPSRFDPRLPREKMEFLAHSNALILNIDYPLGLTAYNILSKVAEHSSPILGVYVMGKAATLNGRLGDVMVSTVVHDEHSQNTYLFQNAFTATDIAPYLVYGTVLDNQKALSVLGTFLQNADYMTVFYREGFTVLEMESGPFLSTIYEMSRPKRHPVNEVVTLYGAPFDIGILHYASDTPLSKGRNLGAGTLSYFGMDSTYAASIAILHRLFQVERLR